MLKLFDYIDPRHSEVFDAMDKFQNSPTNKTAKTQAQRILHLMSAEGNGEFTFFARETEALLKEYRTSLGNYKATVTHDIAEILKSSQPTLGANKKGLSKAKISKMGVMAQMPKVTAILDIFSEVAASCTPNKKITLIKQWISAHDNSEQVLMLQGNFPNYKKLFITLVSELGYDTKEMLKGQGHDKE